MSKLTGLARTADAYRKKNKMGPQTEDSVPLALFAHALIDKSNKVVVDPRNLPGTLQKLLAATPDPAAGEIALMRTSKVSYTLADLQKAGAVSSAPFTFQAATGNGWFVFGWILTVDQVFLQTGLSAATAGISDDNGSWTGSDLVIRNVSDIVGWNDKSGDVSDYPYVFGAGNLVVVNVILTGKTFAQLTSGGLSLTLFYVPIP